jgi:site-specific recombinase XerD
MAGTKVSVNLHQCEQVKFGLLQPHQHPSAILEYHQAQTNFSFQCFSPITALPAVREPSEKRCVLNHFSNRLLKSGLPGAEHAVAYLQHKYRNNLATSTIRQSGGVIISFLSFLMKADISSIKELSRQNIYAYVENDQDRGLKVGGIKTNLQAVYAFLRFLVNQRILASDILDKKIQLKLPELLPRAIPSEDLEALLVLISNVRDLAMILLLLRTGMRIGELLNVKVSDIILPERKILIYLGEKNYQGRVVHFTEDAERALRKWLKERNVNREYLFYGYANKKLGYHAARKALRKYLTQAGLVYKGYSLHSLRHTFATDLLNAGLRLEVLQQLLGHRSIEITMRYARMSDATRESEYFKAMRIIEQGGRYDETHRINSQLQAVFEKKKFIRSNG